MNRSTLETFLGAFVILVTLGFLLFVLQLSDFSSKEGTLYKARFLKVGGLEKGNEVRIGGVKVGTIITRDLDAVNFEAIVKFSVDSSIKLPSDTKAMVIGQGFLGEKYLRLTPGVSKDYIKPEHEVMDTVDYKSLEDTVSKIIFMATEEK
ncbi:MAG: hypothetical protein CFH42_01622 [Alphaproteobacteria bacterium MarineAlpha12_Bin1]|nr:MAG: hypothetical protein CFH42_01622 [Alphaproteobacteria bacterium MarineAlpha12_Bin1]